ncbi:asparagine synthase-related protein [Microbacterium sp. AZCO]|uniref:asparagine synthase-related protein n=1 Tax=Microbacterium sp. AZCO TaxID=3142976 RepID=UPI0031F3930C
MPSSLSSDVRGPAPLPGFLAVPLAAPDAQAAMPAVPAARVAACGPVLACSWGVGRLDGAQPPVLVLSRVVRTARGPVSAAAIESARSFPAALSALAPPFGAAFGDGAGVTMVADSMGLRQLYHSAPGRPGAAALSTSALLVGGARQADLDLTAVAVQAHLGWQLGQRTLLDGVEKLAPGVTARLDARGVVLGPEPEAHDEPVAPGVAVHRAAALLRTSLEALLDEHPDAVLQLTGGQDSRLLLSAIPPSRRKGLSAMTLGVPGSDDVVVARRLAAMHGLDHEVRDLPRFDGLDPAEAWELCRAAAVQLDASADPIALAALSLAEDRFDQGVRISGLGGEVARGFYYVGHVHDRLYSSRDAIRLARWRMFANESVEPALLAPEFAEWSLTTAEAAVHNALRDASDEWFRATDVLYLRHRMQRWAGVTETAVASRRTVLNPMLDPTFLDIAMRLAPADKAHSRFLAHLQLALDPELARIPLEGRPAPVQYAHGGPAAATSLALSSGRKATRKIAQRIRHEARPPAGGTAVARAAVEHWRRHPELLSRAAGSGLVRASWLEAVGTGRIQPRPSSLAFLLNLETALQVGRAHPARARNDEGVLMR